MDWESFNTEIDALGSIEEDFITVQDFMPYQSLLNKVKNADIKSAPILVQLKVKDLKRINKLLH